MPATPPAPAARKVLVLGGGVAGMSTAHELMRRGFDVTVLEHKAIAGGKARSVPASPDGLLGEHGFRFFPSFYQHLTDTMRDIPYPGYRDGVFGNLVNTRHTAMTRYGREPVEANAGFPKNLRDFITLALGALTNPFDLTEEETQFFGERLLQIATSCEERRLAEYEGIGWWEFIAAERFSDNYRQVLGCTTRSLVAADPRKASARTIGDITLQAVLGLATPGKVYDRVLDGPTSPKWIDPWMRELQRCGVDYRLSTTVQALHADPANGRITGVTATTAGGTPHTYTADWYVACVPVEKMATLVNPDLLAIDPGLARIPMLKPRVAWMNGIQFYLTRPVPVTHGHVLYIDAPWALTSISQAQFWPDTDFARYGDGRIRDCLSVDISNWEARGHNGKTAQQCTREEIAQETWNQLRASLNGGGVMRLSDDALHSWFLDPDIEFNPVTGITSGNTEPLLVNEAGTWALRPQAATRVANLFLASDYVQTHTDLACMEGANEAARRAVNGLLRAAGSSATPCRLWPLPEPELLAPFRARDRHRYQHGKPWDPGVLGILG